MTARRRLLVFGLLAGLLALGVSLWLLWPRMPITAITLANAAKIQKGMTLAQVEAILGGPARREGQARVTVSGPQPLQWEADCLLVCVWFSSEGFHSSDGQGQVDSCQIYDTVPSPLEALRRWLRL